MQRETEFGLCSVEKVIWTATSMVQRYGELAQVYRAGEAFTYTARIALDAAVVDGKKEADAMERAIYMNQIAEHRKAKLLQNNKNVQIYLELYNKLKKDVCKKLTDDPLWEEVERKQDPKRPYDRGHKDYDTAVVKK